MSERAKIPPLELAERIVNLLDEGSFTATYKYAVLIALMDLCLEGAGNRTQRGTALPTRLLAEKVVALYWGHALPFGDDQAQAVLRQNTSGQAEILSLVVRFRSRHDPGFCLSPDAAQREHAKAFVRLVRAVEWKLIEMPLPRLQVMGTGEDSFLYDIGWSVSDTLTKALRQRVRAYQEGEVSAFEAVVVLRPGVPEALVRLNVVLRPLVHRQWVAMVAAINRRADAELQLEEFLFGAERVPLTLVRDPLRELQEGRCFYCDRRFVRPPDVDHFLPWSRYPSNALENLVVADQGCNSRKRDFLAASEHLARWHARLREAEKGGNPLAQIADALRWAFDPGRTLNVVKNIYMGLPEGYRLWRRGSEFEQLGKGAIAAALGRLGPSR